MDMEEYINSGIIQDYCLGLLTEAESRPVEQNAILYTEVKQEIESYLQALEQYATDCAIAPPVHIKNKIAGILNNLALEEAASTQHLPIINKYSGYQNWLRIVQPLLPAKLITEEMFVHEIRNDDTVSQTLIWTAIDYPDEVHSDEQECFIILEGRCRCYIEGAEVIELGPGGFLEIPLHKHHDVQIIEPVIAVVQRIKVA